MVLQFCKILLQGQIVYCWNLRFKCIFSLTKKRSWVFISNRLVKEIQFCHCHLSRRFFGNWCFLGVLYIHDDKTFLKYILDCILCLSSLATTRRLKCSHPVRFLWSKVLLQDQRVNCWIRSWKCISGAKKYNYCSFFYLSMFVWKHLSSQSWTNPFSLKEPNIISVLMAVFFLNAIESILFQDSSLKFATVLFVYGPSTKDSFELHDVSVSPVQDNLVVKGSSLN